MQSIFTRSGVRLSNMFTQRISSRSLVCYVVVGDGKEVDGWGIKKTAITAAKLVGYFLEWWENH